MYIQAIEFKKTKESEWERGYYIGNTDNSDKSTFLDKNYQPLNKDQEGCCFWDYRADLNNRIEFRCNEK